MYLRTNVRTLENWEQGRQAKCASGAPDQSRQALSGHSPEARHHLIEYIDEYQFIENWFNSFAAAMSNFRFRLVIGLLAQYSFEFSFGQFAFAGATVTERVNER